MAGHEGSNDQASRRGQRWYVWDVVTVAAVVFAGPYMLPLIGFRAGLRNDPGQGIGLGFPIVCGVWPLLVICLALLIVHMVCTWPRHISNRRKLRLLRMSVTVILVVCVILPFTPLRIPGPPGFDQGFRRYIRGNVDISAVQAWLGTLSPDVCAREPIFLRLEEKSRVWPEVIDWPSTLTHLDPFFAWFRSTGDGRVKIRLVWSTVFDQWGVEIGPEDMPIPNTQPREKMRHPNGDVYYEHGEYRLPLAPGAYVWHDIE